jgi:predicted dinucleotide-binding enzyme
MRVAIIGVGNVGKALGTATIAAGHSVVLAASDPAHAAAAAESVGATAAASNTEAAQGADLVVLAVPGSAVRAVATEIADAVGSGVVVDSTNPLNATYTDLDIEGVSGAADLQALLPSAKVVKAFNTVFASRYAAPTETAKPSIFTSQVTTPTPSQASPSWAPRWVSGRWMSAACGWRARWRNWRS